MTVQPGELDGTKVLVLGPAVIRFPEGGTAPKETGIALVHVMVVVSRELSGFTPTIKNLAEVGMAKHACGVVMSPRSSDQNPPGVSGWLVGNASTSRGSHDPLAHVAFVTSNMLGGSGAAAEEQARPARPTSAAI
ncbi:MAG TPA: hypothetical protein VEU73_05275 [Gemmatimonadales bacterium]|nr:hypothetical protein [Gemmatimonadales bacterium]